MFDMDNYALFSSEVFRSLIDQEMKKEAQEKQKAEEIEKIALNNFIEFQKKVNSNNILKEQFKKLQQRFINDLEYRKATNEDFVRGVMLLKFEDEI